MYMDFHISPMLRYPGALLYACEERKDDKEKAESACDGGLVHIQFIGCDGRETRMREKEKRQN
jgi:hypothetical protein